MMHFTSERWAGILGMNARNLYVERENTLDAIRLVNNKLLTKTALQKANIPVAPTLALVSDRRELASIDWQALPDSWVVKPNRGRQGAGVLLVAGRDTSGWCSASGRHLDQAEVEQQIREILEGEVSSGVADRDDAIMEPLIVPMKRSRRWFQSGCPTSGSSATTTFRCCRCCACPPRRPRDGRTCTKVGSAPAWISPLERCTGR